MVSEKITVLITGSNQGIGYAAAELLARSDSPAYHVLLCSRDHSKGQAAAAKLANLPGTVEAIQLDVSDASSVAAATEYVTKTFPKLDVLVNNAGIAVDGKVPSMAEAMRQTYETNVIGAAAVTDAMLPVLRKSKDPRLVFVSSELGSIGVLADPNGGWSTQVDGPAYRCSKAALNMLSVYYSTRLTGGGTLAEKAVKVWTLCPGFRGTNLNNYTGTGDVVGGGQLIVDLVNGKRDGEVGQFVYESGVYRW